MMISVSGQPDDALRQVRYARYEEPRAWSAGLQESQDDRSQDGRNTASRARSMRDRLGDTTIQSVPLRLSFP
jgi:hypothetical protein